MTPASRCRSNRAAVGGEPPACGGRSGRRGLRDARARIGRRLLPERRRFRVETVFVRPWCAPGVGSRSLTAQPANSALRRAGRSGTPRTWERSGETGLIPTDTPHHHAAAFLCPAPAAPRSPTARRRGQRPAWPAVLPRRVVAIFGRGVSRGASGRRDAVRWSTSNGPGRLASEPPVLCCVVRPRTARRGKAASERRGFGLDEIETRRFPISSRSPAPADHAEPLSPECRPPTRRARRHAPRGGSPRKPAPTRRTAVSRRAPRPPRRSRRRPRAP
jgi:hypothetical protein